MSEPKRELILATSEGYAFEELEPFFESLARTRFRGVVRLQSDRTFHEFAARGYPYGVRVDRFSSRSLHRPLFRVLSALVARTGSARLIDWFTERYSRVHQRRHLMYRTLLRRLSGDFDRIMLTDVRDVVFQESPFERFPETRSGVLVCFLESRRKPIRECPFNSRWIRALRGDAYLEAFGDHAISCSGTILGDEEGIRFYLDALQGVVRENPRAGWIKGIDQGIHNLLIREGTLERIEVREVENEASWILTMGLMLETDFTWEQGRLHTRDGSAPAVLHQYDRFAELSAQIASEFKGRHGSSAA